MNSYLGTLSGTRFFFFIRSEGSMMQRVLCEWCQSLRRGLQVWRGFIHPSPTQGSQEITTQESREWKVCLYFQHAPWSPIVTVCSSTCRRVSQSGWKFTLKVKAAGLVSLLENDVKLSSSREAGWGFFTPSHFPFAFDVICSGTLHLCIYGLMTCWSRLLLLLESVEVNRTLCMLLIIGLLNILLCFPVCYL